MITATYYDYKSPKGQECTPEQISDMLDKPGGMVWIDMKDPNDKDRELLKSEFHVHPLALEDVAEDDQRPKVVEYGEYIYFVLHEIEQVDGANLGGSARDAAPKADPTEPCVRRGEQIQLFVGYNFFISIHNGATRSLGTVKRRWESTPDQQKTGPYYLLYLLLDTVTDSYFPAIDAFDERVETLEDRITEPRYADPNYQGDPDKPGSRAETPRAQRRRKRQKQNRRIARQQDDDMPQSDRDQHDLSELITLRHNLIMMRRVVSPLRDAVNVLLRRVDTLQDDDNHEDDGSQRFRERQSRARVLFAYFQDVYDHTIRIVDTIDTYRDILSGLVDANLSVISNRTNDIMKVLTSVSIMLMTIGVITGIYGMNFVFMPELKWHYGYFYALGLMVVLCALEFRYFRRRRWL